jgi:hypothetical protein
VACLFFKAMMQLTGLFHMEAAESAKTLGLELTCAGQAKEKICTDLNSLSS